MLLARMVATRRMMTKRRGKSATNVRTTTSKRKKKRNTIGICKVDRQKWETVDTKPKKGAGEIEKTSRARHERRGAGWGNSI